MDSYTSLDTSHKSNDLSGTNKSVTISTTTSDKDNYETLVEIDIKNEESILEIYKTTDFENTISGTIKLIDNYYKDIETNDEYPYFRGRVFS